MNYKLFQVKKECITTCPYSFQDTIENSLKDLDFFKYYELAYRGGIEFNKSIDLTLGDLFVQLNTNKRPKDYKCRSMSVSDIIMIDNEFYYCGVFGFKKLEVLL